MKKLIILVATMLTFATTAFAQLGSLSSDLVFTPITPCRIVDTRGAGGVIPAATSRIFKGWAANYTAQGGSGTNCGLPQTTDIAAIATNLLVIVPAAEGWIAAWPVGTTMPLVSNLNYKANDVLANSAILKINQSTADFNVYTVASTHLAVDVTGYYSKPVATALECVNTAANSADINLGPNNGLYYNYLFGGAPACPTGYTFVNLRCYTSSAFSPGFEHNSGGCAASSPVNTTTLFAQAKCCRIPGR